MRFRMCKTGILLALFSFLQTSHASEGTLTDNQRISSKRLGYDLQYRVYRPAGASDDDTLPTLYVTDGQWYLEYGHFKSVLDDAIGTGLIRPVLVVFLDSRNPDRLEENRRDTEFMCNAAFAAFFAAELVPTINRDQPVRPEREDRVILGHSFGGLNSACFGLMLTDLFSGIAMQSPASDRHVDIVRELYEKSPVLPLRIYLSAGTKDDNLTAARRFRRVLEDKGYELEFTTVREGHDWRNWGPLLDDVLIHFFSNTD